MNQPNPEPRAFTEVHTGDEAGHARATGRPERRHRILLVTGGDDVRRMLESRYDVTGAEVRETLHRAVEGSFDLVVIDEDGLRLDAPDLVRALQGDDRTRALPIILVSAGGAAHPGGLTFPADDVLVRPFSARELLTRVASRIEIATLRRDVDEARRTSQQQLATALRAGRMGSWTLDLCTGVMWTSEACRMNYGRHADESFTYDDLRASIHPDDAARWKGEVDRAIATVGEVDVEYRTQWPDGSVHWVQVRGNCYPDAAGRTATLAGVSLDITPRKLAEDVVRASEMRQQYVLALSDALRPLADPLEMQAVACRVLGEHLGANRVTYFEVQGDEYVVERDFTRGVASLPGRLPIAAFGPALIDHFTHGRTVVAPDTAHDPDLSPQERAAYASIQVGAHLGVPLVKGGALVAGLAVNVATARAWTSDEVAVAEETAERTWAAVERARSEQALRASESRLHLAMSAARVGIWTWDIGGVGVVADGKLAEIFGFDEGAAIAGVTIAQMHDRIHPDDRAMVRSLVERSIASGGPYEAEYRVVHDDGSLRWVDARGSVERDATGRPSRFAGVLTDVTARKQEELNAQFIVDLDRALGDWSEADDIQRVATEALGAYLQASRCYFAHIVGERVVIAREYLGAGVEASVVGEHPVDAFNTDAFVERSLRGEAIIVPDVATDPVMSRHRAGFAQLAIGACVSIPIFFSGAWVGTLSLTSASPRGWREDEVSLARQVAARVWPLIERARAMAAVRDNKARFDIVKDAAEVGFWFCDLPFDRLDWDNRVKEHFWLPPDADVTFDRFYSILHPDDREPTRRAIDTSIDEHAQYDVEYRTVSPGGQHKWIRAIGRAFYDAFGKPVRFDGVTVDISEAKQAEASLRENDRRKDEFLAMLAHELRNPLAPIRNAAQVLKLTGATGASQQWASDVIERQAQHLTRLVDDLLDVSRITQGKITLQREPLDVASIIHRAIEASRPLIDARKHALALELPAQALEVTGDLTRLVQVVSNLLNNAAKYTDEGGQITVSASAVGDDAVIRVRDNGLGLPAELLPRVFDLFTQADRSLDRSQGGLGIGLTLVRRLVEMHGGRVEAHSDGPGRGSEFVVCLPRADAAAAAAPPPGATTERAAPAPPLRVLVVEDNVDSAEMMAFMLKLDGHEIQTAHDGLSAVAMARRHQPHVVLCDIGLPGMDGYDVATHLRGDATLQQTRLIAVSGYGQDEDRRRAREAGFDYHLVKPVDPETLTALLDAIRNERARQG